MSHTWVETEPFVNPMWEARSEMAGRKRESKNMYAFDEPQHYFRVFNEERLGFHDDYE